MGDIKVEEDFSPREYQVLLYDKAVKQNCILYLPTGSGKTYIAILLIRHYANILLKPFRNGGKRGFFIVNTVALAKQQAEAIQRHSPMTVAVFTGDMNLDNWSEAVWTDHFRNNNVLVMTSQIFLNLFTKGYLLASDIQLIIFDECHRAVENHAMREIMQYITNQKHLGTPRILGLSATILNGNVKLSQLDFIVRGLETTFTSTIVSVDHKEDVIQYSTKPIEKIIKYDSSTPSHLSCVEKLKELKVRSKKIRKMLVEVYNHIEILGLFGGSQACLGQMICTDRIKYLSKNEEDLSDCLAAFTAFLSTRKYLEKLIISNSKITQLRTFSSPRVLKLVDILTHELNNTTSMCSIVFVKERFTALSLYRVLKAFAEVDPKLEKLKADFIVGFASKHLEENRESELFRKWNREALVKFANHETNVLVSSSVLEEGVDVPSCNLVVMFDKPTDYRQYVQSKGRARKSQSKFYLFIEDDDKKSEFERKISDYHKIQDQLNGLLIGRFDKEPPERNESREIFYPAGIGGAFATPNTSISLLNKYCGVKSKSKYSNLSPSCEFIPFQDSENNQLNYQCKLTLPKSCGYTETMIGPPERNKKTAKKMASYALVKKLHEVQELDDNLVPYKDKPNFDYSDLFLHWKEEKIEEKKSPPGTNKFKRKYDLVCPLAFEMCNPRYGLIYLHTLEIRPAMETMRVPIFKELLSQSLDFGLLSSKPLPGLTPIPLYLPAGIAMLRIKSSNVEINTAQLEQARNFHRMIFSKVLPLLKKFCVFETYSDWNGYLVVPSENLQVRWDIVNQHQNFNTIRSPSPFDCVNAILSPTYGQRQSDIFIGMKVETELTTNSPFPEGPHETYKSYFLQQYTTECIREEENLVLVEPISRNLNHISPKGSRHKTDAGASSKKLKSIHYVPELCIRYSVPPWMWYKSTTLPTALHRIHSLLLAEELRYKISQTPWQDLDLESPLPLYFPSEPKKNALEQDRLNLQKIESGAILEINRDRHKKGLEKIDNQNDDILPVDIYRNFDKITPLEIKVYHNYVKKPVILPKKNESTSLVKTAPTIDWIGNNIVTAGPNHQEVLQALTAASAKDGIDSERLETLGDSVLKLCVSYLLFKQYMKTSEGALTVIKGQMVGNRNLYYCSDFRNLPAIINTNSFQPELWLPPCQGVPEQFRTVMREVSLDPKILDDLVIPEEEQMSGIISDKTRSNCESIMLDSTDISEDDPPPPVSPLETYLRLYTISDKAVSDACEALIGLYTIHWGLSGALRVLSWFEVFPQYIELFDDFDGNPFMNNSATKQELDFFLPWLPELEKLIGYTFKNKGWVLQAFTHDSSNKNKITCSLERLEFLGDAVVDALITSYIFQYCKELDPGEITDLRSALVNNLTFSAISIRNNFHRYLIYDSHALNTAIDKFAEYQEKRNHVIDDQILIKMVEDEYYKASDKYELSEDSNSNDSDIEMEEENEENEENIPTHSSVAISMDVPKVLGDIFESLIGAIFLDSNLNLSIVWQCIHSLMENEIEEFTKNIPIQPVRRLYEMNEKFKFGKTEICEDRPDMLKIKLKCRGKLFIGYGKNKNQAKRAASKLALSELLGC